MSDRAKMSAVFIAFLFFTNFMTLIEEYKLRQRIEVLQSQVEVLDSNELELLTALETTDYYGAE